MSPFMAENEGIRDEFSPEALRKRAAALEQEARYAEWRKGFFCGYKFGPTGKCYEEWLVVVPCPDHTPYHRDEYGSGQSCPNCRGSSGNIRTFRSIRAPQYDAPRPPEKYTP